MAGRNHVHWAAVNDRRGYPPEGLRAGGRHWGAGGPYGIKFGSPEGDYHAPYADGYGAHLGGTDKGSRYN